MVNSEPLNTITAGINTNHSTVFTLLLVMRTQRYMWIKCIQFGTVRIAK